MDNFAKALAGIVLVATLAFIAIRAVGIVFAEAETKALSSTESLK